MIATDYGTALFEVERLTDPAMAPALTQTDIDAALDAARVADSAGLGPVDAGYVAAYDTDLAVAELCELRGMRAAITGTAVEWTSEGTTVKPAVTDWAGLASRFRARSVTLGGTGSSWGVITIERTESTDQAARSAEFGG